MLKWGLLGIFGLLTALPMRACDVCGCSVGGAYYGVLPFFQQHFIGLRYQSRQFESRHLRSDPQPSKEHFQTLDLWGRVRLSDRWQLMAFVPYHQFSKTENGVQNVYQGVGDVSVLAQMRLLNIAGTWSHTLVVGGGVKLPTGESQAKQADGRLRNPNLQMGSGSIDGVLSLNYLLKNNQNGVFMESNFRFNMPNMLGYRAGHRAAAALKYVRWLSLGRQLWLPTAGLYAEWVGRDAGGSPDFGDSSGGAVLGSLGLDMYRPRWTVGALWQQPLVQNMGDGLVQAKSRWSVNLTYLF